MPAPVTTEPGITRDRAIALATVEAGSGAVLVSAASGRLADVGLQDQVAAGYPVRPDDLVWAVTFTEQFHICPPDGSDCWSPRPGTEVIILDYRSGEFLAGQGMSPPR